MSDIIHTTQATATPPPSQIYGGELTEGERKFFETGDLAHLDDKPATGATVTQTTDTQQATADVEAPADEVDPDQVTVGADGKARDAKGRWVKSVPHHVFHAKNEKLKQTAADLQKERERFIRAEERLTILNEAMAGGDGKTKGAGTDAEREIDPSEDIFGAFKQVKAKLEKLQQEQTEAISGIKSETEAQRSHSAFVTDAQTFVRQQPDFGDAFQHLVEGRHKELEMLGITDKAARDAQITQEARSLVQDAQKAGQSPAQRLYAIAKLRGYAPKQAAAADPAKGGAAAAIQRTNDAQAAALSLKGAGGGGPSDSLTLAQLADMSDAQWEVARANYVARHGKPAWDRLLSGR